MALLLRSRPNISRWTLLAPLPPLFICLAWLCIQSGLFRGVEVRSTELFTILGYSLIALIFGCVVAACVRWEGNPWFAVLRLRPVVYIGTISYTVYLAHFFIYVGVSRLLTGGLLIGDLLRGIVAASLTVGLAALSWKYFETPILRLRNWPFALGRREVLEPSALTGLNQKTCSDEARADAG